MIHSRQTVIARTLATAACAALLSAACVAGGLASPSSVPTLSSPGPTPSTTERNAPSLSPTPASSPTPLGTGSTAPAVAPTALPGGPTSTTEIGEANKDQSLAISVGATVTLVLHNIYWKVQGSSNPAVLALVGPPVYSGAGPIACIPGTGCGTLTASFKAVAPGSAVIFASRTSCGEALQCTGGAGTFEVTVVVTP